MSDIPTDYVSRDHLRVCGADVVVPLADEKMEGSPPRVRSRRSWCVFLWVAGRITSACAEQTPSLERIAKIARDHLRVCGADDIVIIFGAA